jgi:hypothetical protein
MDEVRIRAELERHWEFAGRDEDIAHEIYHEDAVLEYPQSGERFEGLANFRGWRSSFPARLKFKIRRITGSGDVWVAENLVSYDDGPWNLTVNVLQFRGDKVFHERAYITQPWDAAEWRKPWRAKTTAV